MVNLFTRLLLQLELHLLLQSLFSSPGHLHLIFSCPQLLQLLLQNVHCYLQESIEAICETGC